VAQSDGTVLASKKNWLAKMVTHPSPRYVKSCDQFPLCVRQAQAWFVSIREQLPQW